MNIFYTSQCPTKCAEFLDTKRVIKMTLETAQLLYTAIHINRPQDVKSYQYCSLVKVTKNRRFVGWTQNSKVKYAHYLNGVRIYAPTHVNHPCTVWARKTRANYQWLFDHFKALLAEYNKRTGKTHKCSEHLAILQKYASLQPAGELTPHANCAANIDKGVNYKHIPETTQAYKLYLEARWKTDTLTPTW